MKVYLKIGVVIALLVGVAFLVSNTGVGAQAQSAPRYHFDPGWPKPLPNKWKIGGITGLAVDRNDDVWVLNRPNDLTDIELHAELTPPAADCCVRPPSMIHIDKNGNVIGSFDAPQGHGMDVDSQGFVYIGQDTVRKYDPKSGKVVAEIARVPETEVAADLPAVAAPLRNAFPDAADAARSRDSSDAAAAAPQKAPRAEGVPQPSAPSIRRPHR